MIDYTDKKKKCRKCDKMIPLHNWKFFNGKCHGCWDVKKDD